VEALAATAVLCGSVLAIATLGRRCAAQTQLNRQREMAVEVAERQLTMVDYLGVERFAEMGYVEGVVEDLEPQYRWQVETQPEDIDNLYLVTVTVSWGNRGHLYQLSVDTMLNGKVEAEAMPLEEAEPEQ